MASLKVMLDRENQHRDGTCPIGIKVLHDRNKRLVHLAQRIKPDDWDWRKSMVKIKPGSIDQKRICRRLNYYIEAEVMKLKKIILDLEANMESYTVDDVVQIYQQQPVGLSVFSYTRDIVMALEKIGKNGNSNVYRGTMGVLQKYINGRDLAFDEVNYGFLKKFESHLEARGNKVNTISFYLRTLRSVFNRAIKDGIIREECYPFKKIKIKKEKTVKRAIYKDDITAIRNVDLSDKLSMELARDLFLFSFYMRGMSFKDIVYLKVSSIVGDRIYYSRQKTAQKLNVKLTESAREIMLKYNSLKDWSSFIFPIIKSPGKNEFCQYKTGYRQANRRLKQLGALLGLKVPLTTYVARHSWASIAKRSGIPTSVISEGLGHDSEKTTQIYLDSFENNVLDAANDIVTNF